MTTREGRAGLTRRLAERGGRFATAPEAAVLRAHGWRKTRMGVTWIAPGGGLWSVEDALADVGAFLEEAGDMNTSDGLGS